MINVNGFILHFFVKSSLNIVISAKSSLNFVKRRIPKEMQAWTPMAGRPPENSRLTFPSLQSGELGDITLRFVIFPLSFVMYISPFAPFALVLMQLSIVFH